MASDASNACVLEPGPEQPAAQRPSRASTDANARRSRPGAYAVAAREGKGIDRTVVVPKTFAPTVVPSARQPAANQTRSRSIGAASREAAYPGDLVRDVVLYRNLRVRLRRGDELAPPIHRRCLKLEQRLLQPVLPSDAPAAGRKFARFTCRFTARLHLSRPSETGVVVEVRDFGVGGARVANPGMLLDVDELAWLAIDFVGPRGTRKVVFTSRVVWLGEAEMGLVFAGAPQWARRHGLSQHEATLDEAAAR